MNSAHHLSAQKSARDTKSPLLQVRGLTVKLRGHKGTSNARPAPRDGVYAVRDVDFDVWPGEAVGLVGESGSGKSLTAKSLMGLIAPSAKAEVFGDAMLEGINLLTLAERKLQALRGKKIAMIFQDPMTALSPFFTIRAQMMETLRTHASLSRHEADQRSVSLLSSVGIRAPEEKLKLYPHQFSGGMRQRVVIAMALAHSPSLLIADEPTTGLDAVTQVQLLELFKELCHRHQSMGVLFISHDVGAVETLCDRTAVMYAGQIVETNKTRRLLKSPAHPYTAALLGCLPRWAPRNTYTLAALQGFPPQPSTEEILQACAFAPRCRNVTSDCLSVTVPWSEHETLSGVRCLSPLSQPHPKGAQQ